MKEALFYEKLNDGTVKCWLCPHYCRIKSGGTGLCSVRKNNGGTLYATSYGQIASIALDPIEKKPLKHFHPCTQILSVGSYGCNMKCPYCQNHRISQEKPETKYISPQELLKIAKGYKGNIGIAFTYNEPLISPEYILDTAPLFKKAGLEVILITNGLINPEPLKALLPHMSAMNIDLKAFAREEYKHMLHGCLYTVENTIEEAAKHCHVEITSLIVPKLNTDLDDWEYQAEFLEHISPNIPLHISRFFPQYRMTNCEPTPIETMKALADIAKKRLKNVYLGNV